MSGLHGTGSPIKVVISPVSKKVIDKNYSRTRKFLSTLVETAIEKTEKKSIWNFRNNLAQYIRDVPEFDVISAEATDILKHNPNEVDSMKKEMIEWYTGENPDSHERYNAELVAIHVNNLTPIFFTVAGYAPSYIEELNGYYQKDVEKF